MPTDAEIRAWALGIGFDDPNVGLCVGRRYAREHDGQLPGLDALCSWANTTGVRQADGTWVCQDSGTTTPPALPSWFSDSQAVAWAKANPMISLVVGLVGLRLVFGPTSRRRW